MTAEKGRARLGAHMSIAGGLSRAIDRAGEVDATALQVFVKSARQWSAKPLDETEVREFRRRLAAEGLRPYTLAHASYLINLASPDGAVRERSERALLDEIDRCARLHVPYLVFHPGSHLGTGEDDGLDRVATSLDRVIERISMPRGAKRVRVLLETTAGQGSNLGYRFRHLGRVLERSKSRRSLGVCLDTCHLLAAGYDFRDSKGYTRMMAELEREVGIRRVCAIHLNDSKYPVGSRRDRHEHIGRGEVGLSGFRSFLRDARLADVPMVLETPKGTDLAEDRRNLEALRELLPGARR